MFHPHSMLGKVVLAELTDVHTEPGLFVDSEQGLAAALLVGRCRLCGIIYMPLLPIPPHDDINSPMRTNSQIPLISNSPYPDDGTHQVSRSEQR